MNPPLISIANVVEKSFTIRRYRINSWEIVSHWRALYIDDVIKTKFTSNRVTSFNVSDIGNQLHCLFCSLITVKEYVMRAAKIMITHTAKNRGRFSYV